MNTLTNPTALSEKHQVSWRFLFGSLLILGFGSSLSHWLGLYGSVFLVGLVCFAVIWPMRVSDLHFDMANVLLMFVAYYFLLFVGYGFMNAIGLSHFLGAGGYSPREDSPENLSSLASIYAAGTLFAVYSGYAWSKSTASPTSHSRCTGRSIDLTQLRRLDISAQLALGCSYVGVALLVYFLGGSSIIGKDPTEVATVGSHGLYWAQSLIWANHWAVIVNFFIFTTFKEWKYLFLTLLSAPLFIVEFLLSGSKSAILFPILGFLIVRHYCYQRINWKTLVAFSLAVAAVFAAGYAYRSTGARASDFSEGVGSFYHAPALLLETIVGRFYGTDSFAMVLDSVRGGHSLLMGRSLADLFTWYIPRWLWPAKPLSYSLIFGEEFISKELGGGDVYISPSLPGELYLNFGWLGLPIGGIVCGRILREIQRRLTERSPRRIELLVLYSVIAPLAASLSGGPISAIIEFILTRVIVYAFLFWLAGLIVGLKSSRAIAVRTSQKLAENNCV